MLKDQKCRNAKFSENKSHKPTKYMKSEICS